jgi:hypothetical protein
MILQTSEFEILSTTVQGSIEKLERVVKMIKPINERLNAISIKNQEIGERMGCVLSLLYDHTEPLTEAEKKFYNHLKVLQDLIQTYPKRIDVFKPEGDSTGELLGSLQLIKLKESLEIMYDKIAACKKRLSNMQKDIREY